MHIPSPELVPDDSGLYTCKVENDVGSSYWSAYLNVESISKDGVIFHRMPEQSTFPGPPSKPQIIDVGETSVKLNWKENVNHGASPVLKYIVEYASPDILQGWTRFSDTVIETQYNVDHLQPLCNYVFIVRAINSHGVSQPSAMSNHVKTRGDALATITPPASHDQSLIKEKLTGPSIIHALPLQPLGPRIMRVSWEVRRNAKFVDSFTLVYKKSSAEVNRNSQEMIIKNIPASATLYVLSDLEPFTWYEAMIQPVNSKIVGTESNHVRAKTSQDIPSQPPRDILFDLFENNTIFVSWETPHKSHINGILTSYKIYIYYNNSRLIHEQELNETNFVITIPNLSTNRIAYSFQISALTAAGEGRKSNLINIGDSMEDNYISLTTQWWFVVPIIVIVSFSLIFFLSLCCLWCYKKKHRSKNGLKADFYFGNAKEKNEILNSSGNQNNSSINQNNSLILNKDGSTSTPQAHNHTYQTLDSFQHAMKMNLDENTNNTLIYSGQKSLHTIDPCIPNPALYMIQHAHDFNNTTRSAGFFNGASGHISSHSGRVRPRDMYPQLSVDQLVMTNQNINNRISNKPNIYGSELVSRKCPSISSRGRITPNEECIYYGDAFDQSNAIYPSLKKYHEYDRNFYDENEHSNAVLFNDEQPNYWATNNLKPINTIGINSINSLHDLA